MPVTEYDLEGYMNNEKVYKMEFSKRDVQKKKWMRLSAGLPGIIRRTWNGWLKHP